LQIRDFSSLLRERPGGFSTEYINLQPLPDNK